MSPQLRCAVCGRQTEEPRRGLCSICDERLRALSVVGDCCALCGLADGRVLRPARLGGAVVCLCRNHAWIAESATPPPRTIDELRGLLFDSEDRRAGHDRRLVERRVRDRRAEATDRRRGHRIPEKSDRRLSDRRTSC